MSAKWKIVWIFLQTFLVRAHCFSSTPEPDSEIGRNFTGLTDSSYNTTIVVIGRSGSGISSTVKTLLGSFMPTNETARADDILTEYEVSLDMPGNEEGVLTVIDVAGLVDQKTVQADAKTLAALQSHLGKAVPDFFIVLTPSDDSRFRGNSSNFFKLLTRVKILQEAIYGRPMPKRIVLLLSKFFSLDPDLRSDPSQKLQSFSSAFKDVFSSAEVSIVVGENKGRSYGLEEDQAGNFRLNRKTFYPANIFAALRNLTLDPTISDQITLFESLRRNGKAEVVNVKRVPSDALLDSQMYQEFLLKLAEPTELSIALGMALKSLNLTASLERDLKPAFDHVNNYLYTKGYISSSSLPRSILDKVKFFQGLGPLPKPMYLILGKLGLKMPLYTKEILVGRGYDLTADEASSSEYRVLETAEEAQESDLGYKFSPELNCSLLPSMVESQYSWFVNSTEEYVQRRQEMLNLITRGNTTRNLSTTARFEGRFLPGFSAPPTEPGQALLISAVKEFRIFRCQLSDPDLMKGDINTDALYNRTSPKWKQDLISLASQPLKTNDEDNLKNWMSFFGRYGTHVVTSAYGGGYVEGKLLINQQDQDAVNLTQASEKLLSFQSWNDTSTSNETVLYDFKGSRIAPVMQGSGFIHLNQSTKSRLVQDWTESLQYDGDVLPFQITLRPISDFTGEFRERVEEALENYLTKGLVYEARKRNKTGNNKSPTRRVELTRYSSTTEGSLLRTSAFSPESWTTSTPIPRPWESKRTTPYRNPFIMIPSNYTVRMPHQIMPVFNNTEAMMPYKGSSNDLLPVANNPERTPFDLSQPQRTSDSFWGTTQSSWSQYGNSHIPSTSRMPPYPSHGYGTSESDRNFILSSTPSPYSTWTWPTATSPSVAARCKTDPNAYRAQLATRRFRDYKILTIGQGYHALHDQITQASPFLGLPKDSISVNLFKHGVMYDVKGGPVLIVSKNDRKNVEIMNFKRFESSSEYNMERLNNISGWNSGFVIGSVQGLPATVRMRKNEPGVFFPGKKPLQEFQCRRLKIELHSKKILNETFQAELDSLGDADGPCGCDWLAFFDKYGTHFIKSGYVGRTHEVEMQEDASLERLEMSANIPWECDTSWSLWPKRHRDIEPNHPLKIITTRNSLEFATLGSLFIYDGRRKFKVDWAYELLLKGKIKC